MDLLKGYWEIPLTDRAKQTSAFVTPDGLHRVSGKAGNGQDTDADTNLDPMRIELIVACVQCITLCYSSVVLVSPGKGWSMTPCIKYLHYPLSIA